MTTGFETLNILQVSTMDVGGGAEKVAWNLFNSFRTYGYKSWLAVGYKYGNDPDVLLIPNREFYGRWFRFWKSIQTRIESLNGQVRGVWWLANLVNNFANPAKWLDAFRGVEDFRFPGTRFILRLTPKLPSIIHCHNLHGRYFDLRLLSWLTQQVPVVLTLHDAWLISGHCAHSFECERWKTGCGSCPDLTIPPALRRDATVYNWGRKKEIYRKSQLYVATPCRWLMRKIEHSIFSHSIVESRIIPYGVDLKIFHPEDKKAVRETLGIPPHTKVLLFTANKVQRNIWKNFHMLQSTLAKLAVSCNGQNVLCIALGEDAPVERTGNIELRFVPYQRDPEVVARYYQAADVYIHPARVDTFPNTILESLACGTPVVATAVGGIPEQVLGWALSDFENLNKYRMDQATGMLVPPGDADAMTKAVTVLLFEEFPRRQLGENAARDAECRFDLRREVTDYLEWYHQIIDRRKLADHSAC